MLSLKEKADLEIENVRLWETRVALGAQLLDQLNIAWDAKIDVHRLHHPKGTTISQLWPFIAEEKVFKEIISDKTSARAHGFIGIPIAERSPEFIEADMLATLWVVAILDRQIDRDLND